MKVLRKFRKNQKKKKKGITTRAEKIIWLESILKVQYPIVGGGTVADEVERK